MRRVRVVHVVISLAAFALMAGLYRLGGAQAQTPAPAAGAQGISPIGRYQLISGREQWYERNVPVVHEAVLMLDTGTGQVWRLSDLYGAKKWETIDPPKASP